MKPFEQNRASLFPLYFYPVIALFCKAPLQNTYNLIISCCMALLLIVSYICIYFSVKKAGASKREALILSVLGIIMGLVFMATRVAPLAGAVKIGSVIAGLVALSIIFYVEMKPKSCIFISEALLILGLVQILCYVMYVS